MKNNSSMSKGIPLLRNFIQKSGYPWLEPIYCGGKGFGWIHGARELAIHMNKKGQLIFMKKQNQEVEHGIIDLANNPTAKGQNIFLDVWEWLLAGCQV